MTFTELVNEVYGWTNRPDLVTQTKSAVRAATLKFHRKEKWWRDRNTVTLTGLAPATVQLIDIAANLPRFRQVSYIKLPAATVVDPFTGVTIASDVFLDIVDADDLLDLDGFA